AGPTLATFSEWLEVQRRQATPKSLFGPAIDYSRNQRASLVRYLDDARFAIDNGEAERAIRPLAVGRSNWLHVGGDGGVKDPPAALEGGGQRGAAPPQPVVVHRRRARSTRRTFRRCRRERPSSRCLGRPPRPDRLKELPSQPEVRQSGSSTDGSGQPLPGQRLLDLVEVALPVGTPIQVRAVGTRQGRFHDLAGH